jgi:hypothetical protein
MVLGRCLNGLFLTILIAVVPAASPAFAGIIDYTLTGPGVNPDVITFSLSDTPTPQACNFFGDTSCFTVSPVSITIDGTTATGEVSFYQSGVGGGLTISEGTSTEVNNNGPGDEELFSGTLADPTLETFSGLQLVVAGAGSPILNEAFVLNATVAGATAPEPSSMLLLLAGLAGAGMCARKRF